MLQEAYYAFGQERDCTHWHHYTFFLVLDDCGMSLVAQVLET